jgi:hypothetical protein
MNWLSKLKDVFVKNVPSDSTAKSVNTTDILKVTRTAVLLGISTAVVELLNGLQPEMFGEHAAIATVVLALLGELSVRFIKNNGKKT